MNPLNFKEMWAQLSGPRHQGQRLRILRFPPEVKPELFLGLDSEDRRCLLLEEKSPPALPTDTHENLSLDYISDPSSGYLAIRLEDFSFCDLFDDLVSSILLHVRERDSTPDLTNEVIQIFLRWSAFFDSLDSKILSPEALRGLFGELLFLEELLQHPGPSHVNEILESWRGPYHNRTDFELPDKHVEVKTISNSSMQVKVSSEYQLEEEPGLGIELIVFFVEVDPVNGLSLGQEVDLIKDMVLQRFGDFSIVLQGLRQLGLTPSLISDYDNSRFRLTHRNAYDAAAEGFPKLVRSKIPEDIKSLRYTLKLHELSPFLLS